MREKAKKITAQKLADFCTNTVWGGICRYLRENETGQKVCIRETKEGEGILAQPNCQMQQQAGPRPPCQHSAIKLEQHPGQLKCQSCGKVRKCEHPLIGLDEAGNEVCSLCGLITKAKAGPSAKLPVTGNGANLFPPLTRQKTKG